MAVPRPGDLPRNDQERGWRSVSLGVDSVVLENHWLAISHSFLKFDILSFPWLAVNRKEVTAHHSRYMNTQDFNDAFSTILSPNLYGGSNQISPHSWVDAPKLASWLCTALQHRSLELPTESIPHFPRVHFIAACILQYQIAFFPHHLNHFSRCWNTVPYSHNHGSRQHRGWKHYSEMRLALNTKMSKGAVLPKGIQHYRDSQEQ